AWALSERTKGGWDSLCVLPIWSKKTAAWCIFSEKKTRSLWMPFLFIKKSSSQSLASRYSETSWLQTRSVGLFVSPATIPNYRPAITRELSHSQRVAIAHG